MYDISAEKQINCVTDNTLFQLNSVSIFEVENLHLKQLKNHQEMKALTKSNGS